VIESIMNRISLGASANLGLDTLQKRLQGLEAK
jgi:hypothetical protein